VDKDGGFNDYTTVIAIANVAPTATVTGPASTTVGALVTINIGATDPSAADTAAGFTFTVDWGDGTVVPGLTGPTATHTYTSTGSRTISVTATDKDAGTSAPATLDISVGSSTPTATLSNSGPVTEGSTATVTFTAQADPGSSSFTYSYDFDNDGTFEITASASASATVPASFLDDGPSTRTVRARISNDNGGSTDYMTDIVVTNVAPTATIGNNGPVAEGSTATVTFTGQSDPSTADVGAGFAYSYDFDNNGTFEITGSASASATVPASFLDHGPSTRTVRGRIADKDGDFTDYTTVITVTNAAPTATINAPSTGTIGVPVTIKVGATDPSAADTAGTFTYTVSWGDGSAPETLTGPSDPPVTHTYAAAGTFTIAARATDADGAISASTTASIVISAAPVATTLPTPGANPGSNLPRTGSDAGPTALLGLGLLLSGALLALVSRRRTQDAWRHAGL
jgi:LPXTG-motif cell wall-anchored protein